MNVPDQMYWLEKNTPVYKKEERFELVMLVRPVVSTVRLGSGKCCSSL
jgi:glycerol-3-phosphate cytidylyltransferase-like family protein